MFSNSEELEATHTCQVIDRCQACLHAPKGKEVRGGWVGVGYMVKASISIQRDIREHNRNTLIS